MSIQFKDNSKQALSQMDKNIIRALTAMGIEAVGATKNNIKGTRYGKPIIDTGTLRNSITKEVHASDKVVKVGSNVEYASYVHDGTEKMTGRPFLKDAILENREALQDVAAKYLKEGFSTSSSITTHGGSEEFIKTENLY